MNDDDTIGEEDRKKAEELRRSFSAETRAIGSEELKKIRVGGMIVLVEAGNRFASGFSDKEVEKARAGNILPFAADVVQWIEVCKADRETVRRWRNNPSEFTEHCDGIIEDMPVDLDELAEMFAGVMEAQGELRAAQVEAKEDKTATKASGAKTAKKKAPARRKKANTSSR